MHQNSWRRAIPLPLVASFLSLLPALAAEPEVNVPGKPLTWYGTAAREDIGHIADFIATPPNDPRKTFAAHRGDMAHGRTIFFLRTPRPGRYVFAYSAMLGKQAAIAARHSSGDGWVELPPGRIDPDYFRDWDQREFCYWVDIPDGQEITGFKIVSEGVRAALIAEPRLDPFEGMPGGEHPVFDIPDTTTWNDTELGRAIIAGAGGDPSQPMDDRTAQRRREGLATYEKMSYYHLMNSGRAWGIALDGFRYRASGDVKWARAASEAARRVGRWPTWGYIHEWDIDKEAWAGPGHERMANQGPYGRNHTLQTSIMLQAMAIAYDLASDGMAPDARAECREALDHYAHLMYVRSILNPWNTYHHDNWSGHLLGALGLAGAALHGESRYADDWTDRFRTAMPHYLADLIDPTGVHRETLTYSCFGLNPLMLAGLALERQGEPPIYQAADGRLDKFLTTIVYFISPNGQAIRDFGDTGNDLQMRSHSGLPDRASTALVAMTRGSWGDRARWAAHRGARRWMDRQGERRAIGAQEDVMNLLFFRPGPERSPAEYPGFGPSLHRIPPRTYPHDNGYFVIRTGFDSPDDIKLVLKCGNAAGGHGQPCQGSFILDAYGDLLSQSPGYNLWGGRTRAHNLITIDGKGQVEGHSGGSGRKENDGHIKAFGHSPIAPFCIADNKPAYDAGGNPVERSLRYVLLVRKPQRRGYVVVIDDMEKDGRPHEYTWNFHTSFNHQIVPDGDSAFVSRGLTKAEAIELWQQRGDEGIVKALGQTFPPNTLGAQWPEPSERFPWERDIRVDLRLEIAWPRDFSHEIAHLGRNWRTDMPIPDHLQITQTASAPVFFVVLYPEREDLGIAMPPMERIAAEGLWGVKIGEDLIVFSRREGIWKLGDVESDARLLYLRLAGGVATGFAVAHATSVRVGDKRIFQYSQPINSYKNSYKVLPALPAPDA